MFQRFKNRQDAGKQLAEALREYAGKENTLLLALPRGGVPVAYEVAQELNLPLDVLLVRKLGVPGHEELAMGAIAWDHICIINHDIVGQLHISETAIEQVIAKEQAELLRRNQLYRDDKAPPHIKGNTIIVVDDGLATGATMSAAVSALGQANPACIIVAVPVGAPSTCRELEDMADKVVCLHRPEPFYGVGQWYKDFSQTNDQEVQALLGYTTHKTQNKSTAI